MHRCCIVAEYKRKACIMSGIRSISQHISQQRIWYQSSYNFILDYNSIARTAMSAATAIVTALLLFLLSFHQSSSLPLPTPQECTPVFPAAIRRCQARANPASSYPQLKTEARQSLVALIDTMNDIIQNASNHPAYLNLTQVS